jgi:hypothetical protein
MTSSYLNRTLLPLAIAPPTLAANEDELADVKVSAVEKSRLGQRAGMVCRLITALSVSHQRRGDLERAPLLWWAPLCVAAGHCPSRIAHADLPARSNGAVSKFAATDADTSPFVSEQTISGLRAPSRKESR